MTQSSLVGHHFNPRGVCTRCGYSREAVEGFGVRCEPRVAAPPVPAPVSPRTRSRDRRIERPLAIVSQQNAQTGTLEALLVSGGDPDLVVAAVSGKAADFDADEAFRELDDLRSRAETVYQWIADGLAEVADPPPPVASPAPPRPRKPKAKPFDPVMLWRRYGRGVLGSIAILAVIAVVALAPAGTVLLVATWVAWIAGVLLIVGVIGSSGCGPAVVCLFVIAVLLAIVEATGVWVGASRLLLILLALLVTVGIMSGPEKPKNPPASGDAKSPELPPEADPALASEPIEYVLQRGEAVLYVPGLYLVGARRALAIAIECKGEDGSLLRRVVLPLAAATRETADETVRMAKAPDLEFAAERAQRAADDAAAAAAVERLGELERSRRSLPE